MLIAPSLDTIPNRFLELMKYEQPGWRFMTNPNKHFYKLENDTLILSQRQMSTTELES